MRLSPCTSNPSSIVAGQVDVLQITDGEVSWICSTAEFLDDNNDEDACEQVRALAVGESVAFFGGLVERLA